MRPQRLRPLAALAVTGVLLLTGCGGDGDSAADEPSAPETSATSEEPTEEPTEEATPSEDAPAADAELTEPGATLAVGDTAVVPAEYGGEEGVVEVTVTEIREGDPADIADVENAEGLVPFHIEYTAASVSGGEALSSWSPGVELDATSADGSRGGVLITTSAIGGCATESAPSDWAAGDEFSGCTTTLAQEGKPITAVSYSVDDTELDRFDGEPVVWEQ